MKEEVAPVLTEYMFRMKEARYTEEFRRTSLLNALRIFDDMKKKDEEGVRPLYRQRTWQAEERRKNKKRKKHGWSSKGGYNAAIMVPSTPNGELASILKEVAERESDEGVKFKIVEMGGRSELL